MMTRASWLIPAISFALAWASLGSPAIAGNAPATSATTPPQPATVKLPEPRPMTVALTTCTRVGSRMVC